MRGNLVTLLCGGDKTNNASSAYNDTSVDVAGNSTVESAEESTGYVGDPMLYILVVLLFYASSITLFMVKYIRKQNEESHLDNDYNTFVRQVGFDEKLMEAKNKAAMRLKEMAAGINKPAVVDPPLQQVTVTSTV